MLIIFDLDGTLINTIDDLGQACNHALSACGFPTHTIEDYPRLVGNGINKLIERALPEQQRNETTVLRLRQYFVPFYDKHNCDLTRPYNGIPELLKALKAAGHTLAVASNKYQAATEKIVAHFFPNTFDVVLGERVDVPRKPDPQIVWDILASLPSTINHKPSTLYVGDSLVDAATAKAANLPFVACTWGFCTKEQLLTAQPDYMITHPLELLNII
ncbi:MAG: HAD family hydrolase [Bacteroidales bacterium]|nr:HAD family hydrolase [Bacteroidales bacterium]